MQLLRSTTVADIATFRLQTIVYVTLQ